MFRKNRNQNPSPHYDVLLFVSNLSKEWHQKKESQYLPRIRESTWQRFRNLSPPSEPTPKISSIEEGVVGTDFLLQHPYSTCDCMWSIRLRFSFFFFLQGSYVAGFRILIIRWGISLRLNDPETHWSCA